LTGSVQMPPLTANVLSYSVAAINSFLLNKFVTFRHRQTRRSSMLQLAFFIVARLICLGLSTLVLAISLSFVPNLAAKLTSVVVTFFAAYALSSRLVYR
jgi:putative flippase GtrA